MGKPSFLCRKAGALQDPVLRGNRGSDGIGFGRHELQQRLFQDRRSGAIVHIIM